MATITFNDNTLFETEQNGNNFITNQKPDFPEDLTNIKIEYNEGTQNIKNGMVVECYPLDNRYWFTIVEKPENEILKEQILDLECIISDLLEMM